MAYRDYDEGRSGPGGGYEDRDRMDREGGRGWMDRAREYFDRARDVGRDLYERERERAHAERYGRGGPGFGGGQGYDRDRYDRDRYDRSFDGPGGGGPYDAGYGGPRDRDYGHDRGYGRGTSGGMGGAGQYGGRPSYAGRGSKNYRRSDARIEEEVHEVLMRHHEIDATDVDVRVQNGEVTLTGEVEDRRTKRLVEEIVEQLPGVRDVHNELKARRGLLGGVASAAVGAIDPAPPTRDREGTGGATRDTVAGSGTSSALGGTGTTTGATTGLGRPGAAGATGGPIDTGTR